MQVRRRRGLQKGRGRRLSPAVFLLLVLLGACLLLVFLNGRVRPVLETVGTSRAKAIANASIMRAIDAELKENAQDYTELVTLQKGEDGEISVVTSNIVKINQLKARLSERVQEHLTLDLIRVSIPLGNLIGGDIFSGRGPSISFKLLPYGSVVVDVANEFTSAGINQTLHRIVLTVSAGLSIVLPLSSVNATVQSGVVVAETIIVGGVPERYATYGAGGTLAQTDALLMMEED